MKVSNNDGFSLIWTYWYHKYMVKKQKKSNNRTTPSSSSLSAESEKLNHLKQKYHIQAIDSNPNISSSALQNKLEQIKEKAISDNSFNSPKSEPVIYTINPEQQAKQIEETLMLITHQRRLKEQRNQYIAELHSYYLNCKNIFIIYKYEKEESVVDPLKRFINESSSLKTQRTNSMQRIGNINYFLNLEDNTSNIERNQSLMDSFDKIENKIEGLEVFDKFAELDGLEIWNAKYLGIPHSFLKIKKYAWTKCLNRPLLHPSQPKTISDLPILPRLTKFKPSQQKLPTFVSFLKLLQQYSPESSPTMDSIFQYNNMPYIFVQDRIDRGGWEENYSVLCYYVAFGDEGNNLTDNFVRRWLQLNSKSQVARIIHEMNERQKNRVKYINKESVSLSLGLISSDTDNNGCIW